MPDSTGIWSASKHKILMQSDENTHSQLHESIASNKMRDSAMRISNGKKSTPETDSEYVEV